MATGRAHALHVGHNNTFCAEGGGVQVCCREYAAALKEAGLELHTVAYEFGASIYRRLVNRLSPRLSDLRVPPGLAERIECGIRDHDATIVFFNQNVFPALSRRLKQVFPGVKQVLLSHGAEAIDFCLEQRIRQRRGTENRSRDVVERMVGREILDEIEQRRWIDAVLTLSPFEVEFERLLGARDAIWLPRTIMDAELTSRPTDGRVGCVSTLNHPPNLDGLETLFDELGGRVPAHFRFRLVGQPRARGESLAARYPFVEYVGPLPDSDLRAEAATWCCFVHPMFVPAKGCSTKLGVALGWGLPIATTELGVRGYVWDFAIAPVARSPSELASLVLARCSSSRFEERRSATRGIVRITPSIGGIAVDIRRFLGTR
jgi:hypothetical protein